MPRQAGPWPIPSRDLERLPEFHAEGARLIDEQPRPSQDLCRNRSVIAEVCDLVRKVLADQRHLEPIPREREAGIDEPIRSAQSRIGGIVITAEAASDIGVVGA